MRSMSDAGISVDARGLRFANSCCRQAGLVTILSLRASLGRIDWLVVEEHYSLEFFLRLLAAVADGLWSFGQVG